MFKTLFNAGFMVEMVGQYIHVTLKNRKVSTLEVALVLDVEPVLLDTCHDGVLIDTSKVR